MKHLKTFESFLNEEEKVLRKPTPKDEKALKAMSKEELAELRDQVTSYLDQVFAKYKKAKGAEKKEIDASARETIQYFEKIKWAIGQKEMGK